MKRELNRLLLLNSIFSHLQMVTQWPDSGRSAKYLSMAEALVEVLEYVDCGSHGGFDRDNPLSRVTTCNVYDRFLTVLRKHHTEADIRPICDADVQTLTRYFSALMGLRSDVYSDG